MHLNAFAIIFLFGLTLGCEAKEQLSPGPDTDGDGVHARFDCNDNDPLIQRQEDGCAPGLACTTGTDCAEGVCTPPELAVGDGIGAGTCAEPSCVDGVRNAFESDTDCGDLTAEGCPPCVIGSNCFSDDHCTTGRCLNGQCGTACANPLMAGENCDACLNRLNALPDCDTCSNTLFMGPNCDQCADDRYAEPDCDTCINPHFETPECDTCERRFTGPECSECANPRKAGEECDECADGFEGMLCDQCTNPRAVGNLCDECIQGFTGPDCQACVDIRRAAPDCEACSERFTGSNCRDCADRRFDGRLCDECSDGFSGSNCDRCTNRRFAGEYCDECAEAIYALPDCEQCVDPHRTGVGCTRCSARFQGDNCDECKNHLVGPNCGAYRFVRLEAGGTSTVGILENGSGIFWGQVVDGRPNIVSISTISVSYNLACGLDQAGQAHCWATTDIDGPEWTPPEGVIFSALATGGTTLTGAEAIGAVGHVCGLDADGTAYCWGNLRTAPADISFTTIAAGKGFGVGLDAEGAVHEWGRRGVRTLNRLEEERIGRRSAQHNIGRPGDLELTSVSAGSYHICGLRANGTAVCWGDNYEGQASSQAGPFVQVVAGGRHSCGLGEDGQVTCWGDCNSLILTRECEPPEGRRFTALGAGSGHVCGVTTEGPTICWGSQRQVPAP